MPPTPAKLRAYLPKYGAIALGILCGWAVLVLKQDPHFAALVQEGAGVTLTALLLTWLGACAAHFVLTGDPAPAAMPMIAATAELRAVEHQPVVIHNHVHLAPEPPPPPPALVAP